MIPQEMPVEFIDRVMIHREQRLGLKISNHNIVYLAPRGFYVTPAIRDYAKTFGIDIIQDPTINTPGENNVQSNCLNGPNVRTQQLLLA
jgi:hypothetical protein